MLLFTYGRNIFYFSRVFKCHQCVFTILYLSQLERGRGCSFEKKPLKSPHLRMLCGKFGLDRHTDKRTKDDQKTSFEL